MEFSANSPVLYIIFGVIILAVLGQSVFFLVRALKRSKQLNMDQKKIKKTMVSSAIFTIAPAVSILIGLVALSYTLGLPLPWLRLSVIGSLSYETIAANNVLSAIGQSIGSLKFSELTATQFVTIFFVMTISIMVGIWLVCVVCKKVQGGLLKMENKDKKWTDTFVNAMFIGMISAFLGFVFCDFASVFKGETYGLVPVLVMFASAITMALCGILVKKVKWLSWLSDYALPIAMIVGMVVAVPLTAWLGVAPVV